MAEAVVPVFVGEVDRGGRLRLGDRKTFDKWVAGLAGKVVEVVVRRQRRRRSTQQNRYYFGVVVKMLANEIGYTRQQMHDALVMHFLCIPGDPLLGIPPTLRRSSKLTTMEFEEYLRNIRVWAAETFSLSIPEPNEVDLSSVQDLDLDMAA
jgi:hypothetical protein